MKKVFCLWIFIILLFNCHSSDLKITRKILVENEWFWYDSSFENGYLLKLKFEDNGTFITTDSGDNEELPIIDGRYSLVDNSIIINYRRYSGHFIILSAEDEAKMGPDYSVKLNLIIDEKNKYYKKYFSDTEKKIFVSCKLFKS